MKGMAMSSQFRPELGAIQAAARVLDSEGRAHGWWEGSIPVYDKLDPIGKDEFQAIVERMLIAAHRALESAEKP